MDRPKTILLLLLIICQSCWAVNDFSDDEHCISLWDMEDDLVDEKGTNDLTDQGSISYSSTCKEGSKSASLNKATPDWANRVDSSLSSGFPGKDSGGATVISFCIWVQSASLPSGGSRQYLMSKYNSGAGDRSYSLALYDDSGTYKWELTFGQSTSPYYETVYLTPTNTVATSQWYHVAFTCDSSGNWRIRTYDETNTQVDQNTGTLTYGAFTCNGAAFELAARSSLGSYTWHGLMDEMVIFDDVLTADEIDDIRSGTYTAPSSGNPWYYYRNQ